jgi:hypothetical protein
MMVMMGMNISTRIGSIASKGTNAHSHGNRKAVVPVKAVYSVAPDGQLVATTPGPTARTVIAAHVAEGSWHQDPGVHLGIVADQRIPPHIAAVQRDAIIPGALLGAAVQQVDVKMQTSLAHDLLPVEAAVKCTMGNTNERRHDTLLPGRICVLLLLLPACSVNSVALHAEASESRSSVHIWMHCDAPRIAATNLRKDLLDEESREAHGTVTGPDIVAVLHGTDSGGFPDLHDVSREVKVRARTPRFGGLHIHFQIHALTDGRSDARTKEGKACMF